MAKINLLPWREAYRKEKKEEFFKIVAGVLIITAVVAYLWVSSVQSAIENQNSRNHLLDSEIANLEKQVKEIADLKKVRDDLLARIKIIQDLQGKRPLIVRYFDGFARAIPDGVYITSITKKDNLVSITGIAESYSRVAIMMMNLDESEWFADTKLSSVTAEPKEGEQAQSFKMTTTTSVPEGMEEKVPEKSSGKKDGKSAGKKEKPSDKKDNSKNQKAGGK